MTVLLKNGKVIDYKTRTEDYFDIFIENGNVILWGLLNCHRDNRVNPLVPVGKSFPLELKDLDVEIVKQTLQDMVHKLNIRFGAMNVELIIDKNNRVFLIDVGPRNGGNMVPDLLGMIFDVDVVDMSIRAAMGMDAVAEVKTGKPYFATHNLHSDKNGTYVDIRFDDLIEQYIVKKCLYKKEGDTVEFFDNASKALGIIFLKFKDQTTMTKMLNSINDHINIILK